MPPRLPPLLPVPRRATPRAGSFRLRDGMPLVLGPDSDDGDLRTATGFRDRCGVALRIETHARADGLGPRLELGRRGDAGEGYRIDVAPDRARLDADGPAGLRWGTETLLQLAGGRARLPACHIDDAPLYPARGIMLDVSRGKVPTLATLRELVDRLASLKLNVLMLYVEHPFAFRRHPRIGEGASPLDAEDLRSLDAYAAERHVELVPSLQSLGHMQRILSLDAYAGLAESDARWTISPADPGTYVLLADLYDEYLPNFRSSRFNLNCDEPWDLEKGRSAARAAELGPGGVYLEHVHRLRDMARERGRRALVWGDVVHAHPGRIPELDRDLVLLDWWYEDMPVYDRVKTFADHGLEFWVCPGTSTWNSLFPRVANSLGNIAGYAEAGRRHGATGLLTTDWGDFGHYNLQGNSWLAYAWTAQQGWSGDAPAAGFDRAFSRAFFGDGDAEPARLYRALGAVHDAGFATFNASALMFLWFDDLDTGYFVEGASPAALRRSAARLERIRRRIQRARPRFVRDPLTWEELAYAADASATAVRKGLAGGAYLAWRRRPASLDAPARRRLARELTDVADAQSALARRFRRLWHARSRPSDFAFTRRRLERSVRGLRRAARAAARGRPPAPPPPHPGMDPASLARVLRDLARST